MAYKVYEFNLDDRLEDIAEENNITVRQMMLLNGVFPPYPQTFRDLGEIQTDRLYRDFGGLQLPTVEDGGATFSDLIGKKNDSTIIEYRTPEELEAIRNENLNSIPNTFKKVSGEPITIFGKSVKNCYILIHDSGMNNAAKFSFPCYPNDVSDSNKANYSAVNILGRSEPFQYYTNSGPREVSVSFDMHLEMCTDEDDPTKNTYVHKLVRAVESVCYPNYDGGIVAATKVTLVIGKDICITGIVSSVSTKYSGPLLYGKFGNVSNSLNTIGADTYNDAPNYSMINLSFSVTECGGSKRGLLSRQDVNEMGGYRT